MSGARYWAGRGVVGIGVLAMLSAVVFVGVDLLPGDAATARLGASATPERVAEVRASMGLDRPLPQRYLEWVGGLLRGDLGNSVSGRPVSRMLADRLPDSVLLVLITVALLVPLSLAIGLTLGRRSGGRTDRITSGGLLLIVALPEFLVAGALVLVFAVGLRWLPAVSLVPAGASALRTPQILVIPVLSLLTVSLAYAVRLIRAATVTAHRAPHAEFLRLNGFPERSVLRHSVLPAVLPTALQTWMLNAAMLLGGTVLVETVVSYPGVGQLLVSGVANSDLPVVQALVMVLGAITLVAMMAADALGELVSRTNS